MFSTEGKTVREIALDAPITTRIFEAFMIDYCCHGDIPFNEACLSAGANPEIVLERIGAVLANASEGKSDSWQSKPIRELIDHILDKHHVFTKQEMGQLTSLMAKVVVRHGEHNPQLIELRDLFAEVCEDMGPHMMKEEMVLFPYIQKIDHCCSNNLYAAFPPFGTVQHPIQMMTVEHEAVAELLSRMRAVSNDYSLPEGACPSFTALYHRLIDFERDMHQHIHLENNVLFPRAVELEQKAFSMSSK